MRSEYDRKLQRYNWERKDRWPAEGSSNALPDRGLEHESGRNWWERAGDEVLSWLGDDYAGRRRRHDDESHRGKGPKNYRRSDERIKEDINDKLTDEWNVDATDIEVCVTEGVVILTGYVSDKHQKRKAEDVAESVLGVNHVENRIRIDSETPKDNVNLIP